jgi:hypothetical protein
MTEEIAKTPIEGHLTAVIERLGIERNAADEFRGLPKTVRQMDTDYEMIECFCLCSSAVRVIALNDMLSWSSLIII